MPWDEGLEGQALDIARTAASPLRVAAGPGTGKTFALMRRLARLLEEGHDPTRILLVTFTRVSAADLERELDRLGLTRAHLVAKGTLHSLCFGLLHRGHVFQFTARVPRPLMKYEERFLLEDLGEYGDFGTIHRRRATLKAFEAAWARQQDQQPGWPTDPTDQAFQGHLAEWLAFHQAILIDEIVPLTLRYLRANPGCPELTQFDHVLVDEYQDLNRAEQSVIDLLVSNGSLALVGDEDQAIYEAFRYAHPEGISQFHTTHPGTHDIPLDVSRRCPPLLVSLANSLIRNNLRRSGRQLIPHQEDHPVSVDVIQWPNMQAEAAGIADFIAARVSSGEYHPGQTLVLCPRRQFGYLIRDELLTRGIAAHSFFHEEALDGNPKVLGDSAAQQSFTLLTLLANPEDKVALRSWLGFGNTSLRSGEYRRLRDYCSQHDLSPWEALSAIRAGQLSIPHTIGLSTRFTSLFTNLQELNNLDPEVAFDHLFPPDQDWAEPFRAIYDQAGEPLTHQEAHDLIRVSITQPELPSDVDYVRVMSLHKSKGLTANNVFVTGCIEGLIPSHRSNLTFENQRRHLEEQRRLLYVALTRARRTLVLSSVLALPRDLAHRMRVVIRGGDQNYGETIASSFLAELGPDCPDAIYGPDWLLSA